MKLLTTLVTTLLALSFVGRFKQPRRKTDKGRDAKPKNQQHDPKPKEKPGQDRDHDADRDHGPKRPA